LAQVSAALTNTAFIEDVEEHLAEPDLPLVDTTRLHPWVADASARLWANGHRQQAGLAGHSVAASGPATTSA
jgi:hypothetical protein